MEHGIGEFVIAGAPLASITHIKVTNCVGFSIDRAMTNKINRIYAIDNFRTIDQDVAFGIRQIVDIVMKALSPGINDTTTAVISIDYLTGIVSHLAAHPFPAHFRFSENHLRVVAKSPSFEDLIDLAFNQTRQNATNNVAIILRCLHALEQIALRVRDGCDLHSKQLNLPEEKRRERLAIISRHMQMTADAARENVKSKDDWAQIAEHIEKVTVKLGWEKQISVKPKSVSAVSKTD